jgi:hypothetical protein
LWSSLLLVIMVLFVLFDRVNFVLWDEMEPLWWLLEGSGQTRTGAVHWLQDVKRQCKDQNSGSQFDHRNIKAVLKGDKQLIYLPVGVMGWGSRCLVNWIFKAWRQWPNENGGSPLIARCQEAVQRSEYWQSIWSPKHQGVLVV